VIENITLYFNIIFKMSWGGNMNINVGGNVGMNQNMGMNNMNQGFNQGFSAFPQNGEEVTLLNGTGAYIAGKSSSFNLMSTMSPTLNEVYVVENFNMVFSFKHKMTNLYLGGTI
jgi:hypothetical protein